jgi:hypothetical protein
LNVCHPFDPSRSGMKGGSQMNRQDAKDARERIQLKLKIVASLEAQAKRIAAQADREKRALERRQYLMYSDQGPGVKITEEA